MPQKENTKSKNFITRINLESRRSRLGILVSAGALMVVLSQIAVSEDALDVQFSKQTSVYENNKWSFTSSQMRRRRCRRRHSRWGWGGVGSQSSGDKNQNM